MQEQLSLNEARQKAYTIVLARQENLPLDTYRTFLQDMNFLTARRRGIDPVGDNIMLSKTTLRWVDIGNQPENNHLQNVEDMMFKFTGAFKPSPTPEVLSLKRHITSKLNMAAKQTNTPRTQHETLALIPQSHPFASQKTITEIARLPLSATPIELQHSLREVEQHIERVY